MKRSNSSEKSLPQSAAPLRSRRRVVAVRSRSMSATSQRIPLSPTVCGVGPSRVLELCTSPNTPIPTRDYTESQTSSCDNHMTCNQRQRQHLSSSLPSSGGGYLRSGRLHPLGIVDIPLIRPDECLGIISTPSREGRAHCRRSCSSAEPRVSLDLLARQRMKETRSGDSTEEGDVKNRISSSEVNSANLLHCHSRSINLPTNTALVPTKPCVESVKEDSRERQQLSPEQHSPHLLLPPVIPTAHEIKQRQIQIEVKTIKKSEQTRKIFDTVTGEFNDPLNNSKLPYIASSHFNQENAASNSSTKNKGLKTYAPREMAQKVSVISLGVATEKTRAHNQRKKHRSPDRKENRLSLGWCDTRPLEPITGQSVYQERWDKNKHKNTKLKSEDSQHKTGDLGTVGEAIMSKDCIHIDVHEYLANDDT